MLYFRVLHKGDTLLKKGKPCSKEITAERNIVLSVWCNGGISLLQQNLCIWKISLHKCCLCIHEQFRTLSMPLGDLVIMGHTLIHSCQFCVQSSGSAVKHHQNRRRTEGPASCFADTDGRSGHFRTGLTVQNAHTGDIVIHQKTHNKITFSGEILSLIFGQSVIFSYGICQKLLQFQHFGNLMPGKHTAH